MPLKPNIQSEKDLLQGLEKSLSTLPGTSVLEFVSEPDRLEQDLDAYAKIRIADKKIVHLLIQVKPSGYPRDLEQTSLAIKKLHQAGSKEETLPVIGSRSVSTGSREMLRERGIGYFDAGGSLYLPLSDGIFFIDRSPPRTERNLQSIYEGRSSQVLHVLLANPSRKWHVNEAAELAEVSPYTVHQVFTRLENQLFLERHGKGPDSIRILEKPGELLDMWAENYSFKQYTFQNYYKWSQSSTTLRRDIAEALQSNRIDYALTLSSGAEMVAPFTSGSERLHFIVPESKEIAGVAAKAGLEPVDDGANVTLMTTKARAPFLKRQSIDDLWVASDVQLYLDLSKWRARGKEQAEHLRRQRLRF
jgi:Transcriptional regulator, AbiEi antitoxin, Type IV TA system